MKVVPTLFLGIFALLGLLGAVAIAIDWLQGVDTYTWEAGVCTIESSDVVQRPGESTYVIEVSYRYAQRGEEHRSRDFQHGYAGSEDLGETERLAARYAVGDAVECWIDPDVPANATLRRANLWRGLWIFVPLLFLAVGVGALWLLHGFREPRDEPGDSRGTLAPIPIPSRPGRPPSRKESPFQTVGLLVGFFAIFFLVGAGFFVPFFVLPALRVVEAQSWREVPCVIVSSDVRSHSSDDGVTYAIEVLYRYEVDGREHRSNRYQFLGGSTSGYDGKAEIVARIPAGTETTCYVDPDDPFEAVIERGFTTDYLFGLLPLVFVAVGLGGMGFVVLGARAVRNEAARPSWGAPVQNVRPSASPTGGVGVGAGATGPMTLEPAMGRLGKLGCAIGVALLWNGITAPFVWIVVKSFREGNPEWFVTVVITPFVLIGLLLLSGIPYSILALANPKARVRVSQRVLRAGEPVQIDWSFVGMASRVQRVKIWARVVQDDYGDRYHLAKRLDAYPDRGPRHRSHPGARPRRRSGVRLRVVRGSRGHDPELRRRRSDRLEAQAPGRYRVLARRAGGVPDPGAPGKDRNLRSVSETTPRILPCGRPASRDRTQRPSGPGRGCGRLSTAPATPRSPRGGTGPPERLSSPDRRRRA